MKNKLRTWLDAQAKYLVDNNRQAILATAVFAVLPFTAWFAQVLLVLVTLRKGARYGLPLLAAALIASLLPRTFSFTPGASLVYALLDFAPCFLGAMALRRTSSWYVLLSVYILQVLCVSVLVHKFAPNFILTSYEYFYNAIVSLDMDSAAIELIRSHNATLRDFFANCLFGSQAMIISLFSIMAILAARSVQARIYNPGGFKKEILNIRGDKISAVVFVVILVAAAYEKTLAINVLPTMIAAFVATGLSYGGTALQATKPFIKVILLFMPLILLPMVFIPFYLLVGLVDSVINFRKLVSKRAQEPL